MPSKGQDYQWLLLDTEGEILRTISPNDMSFTLVEDRNRIERTGTRRQPIDQDIQGWEGDATFEEEDFVIDNLVDAMVNGYFNGEKIGSVEILQTKYVPELGATRTYRYYGVKHGYEESASGQKERVEKTLNWEAEGRELLD